MPAKRRTQKLRMSEAAEVEAWWGAFDCGCDFFGDLKPLGFQILCADHDEVGMSAACEAWQRLCKAFMETWQAQSDGSRTTPWAVEVFGDPCR
jgi:hypothetical protein